MKKTGIVLLSLFYFLVACGFAVNFHFCAGKLKSISLFQSKEDGCCGNKKKSKGCCKEKTVVYKIKDSHKAVSNPIVPNEIVKDFHSWYTSLDFTVNRPSLELHALPDCNAPPFAYPEPVYLLNRNLRI
ncbi:hypothetical protein CNR22_13645 [Sphingobacteriaceae bacterium]|nr:hypothetical protein CNR22_13645 [Sphingobacteriaceae bacterium]